MYTTADVRKIEAERDRLLEAAKPILRQYDQDDVWTGDMWEDLREAIGGDPATYTPAHVSRLETERDELLEAAKAVITKYLTNRLDLADWAEIRDLAIAIDKAEGRK